MADQNKSIKFAHDLIKGRIAEVIFEQMIRDEQRYAVIPFGYEHTVPSLAQYSHLARVREVINNIKGAPDFALVSNDKEQVFLVEVKYRNHPQSQDLKKIAEKLLRRWNPSWLFIASPQGFYCGQASSIVKTGSINRLSERWVAKERQAEYLQLLNEFERK